MFSASTYVIRKSVAEDAHLLEHFAAVEDRRELSGPVLVGEVDGRPAAAVSLTDGRIVTDPTRETTTLVAYLRLRARAARRFAAMPSLPARVRAGIRV
jgi:hypothetical protein